MSSSEASRDRGEQILSAKKKLKSYRAKQALMAQKRASSSSSHSRSGSGVRSVDAPPATAVAEALSNEIVSQASTSAAAIPAASHTRAASRSGHARGHSRAGSISITPNALWSQAQAIASSPAPGSAPVLGRPASIVVPSAGHVRTHSRTHSRNFSRSRPVSIAMLGAKKEEPVVLAIEHRAAEPESVDVNNTQRASQQFLDSSALFGGSSVSSSNLRPSSTASAKRFSNVSPVSPALFERPSSQNVATAAAASPLPSAPNARQSRRLSRHARTPSVATKRESMEIMGGLGAGLGLDMASASSPLHSAGSSRRRSSRISNLPSASLLFGSSDPATSSAANINSSTTSNNVRNSSRASGQQWDWRKAIADAANEAEESSEGRLTALEKLEGRASTTARSATADRPSSAVIAASRASRRLSGHTRTESIQIPNLDEIHQNELNERRASWNSQAFDGATIASAAIPASAPAASSSNRRESWGRSLVAPSPSSLLSAGFASPALPSAYLSSPGRPDSMVLRAESPQPEGLGTLMEEEEEDDATSPTRERSSLDMPVDGRTTAEHELRKQRREVEDETVKRNRRASLAPKPLKLKSRPPSLYLTPSQRSGLVSSPSMLNFPTSPLLAPSIADEATPRASLAALPEAADDDESQVLEQQDVAEASVTMPSRSTTCPNLTSLGVVSEEGEMQGSASEAEEAKDAPSPVDTELSAQDVASQEQRQLEELQQQILRAHRNSVIAPTAAAATPLSAESSSVSSGSATSSSRQGMRTLRLGSQANLSSIMESASAPNAASGSSGAAAVAAAATTTPAQRRRSLIMGSLSGVPMSGSSSRDSDFANSFSSSTTSSRAARRSSIIYKPSTASVPETSSPHSASDSIVSLGGVPLAVHDELKAKANRDAALLESTKKQVEMLERELANETERSAREKAELEQWNLDKEEHLFDRAQRAEAAARQAEDALVTMRAELEQAKEAQEDLQAEREVLQDDIEGWRSRCQDLEKMLRTEKARSDDNRKLRAAARLRIKQLTDALEQSGVNVPGDELGVLAALEMPQLDLAAVLKSPNLGAVSPSLGAAGGLSPSIGSEEAPPQITKLLADMRQQIFNLAGSLEHERKQHLSAKEEVARLQRESLQQTQTQQRGAQAEAEVVAETMMPAAADIAAEEHSFASPDDSRDMSASESFSSVRRSSGMLGKNKRHIFAYDSSMGSFGQSQSSASLSMTMMTDDTAHTDVDSDLSDSFSTKLPCSSESELVGLGMGSLQTLDEIEEVSEVSESHEGGSNGTLSAHVVATSHAWGDIEAGAAGEVDNVRESFDQSESSFGAAHYQDAAENAPPTPDLCRSTEPAAAALIGGGINRNAVAAGEHSTSSSSSSGDSHAAPSTPPSQHAAARIVSPNEAEMSMMPMRSPSPRPEFHREWSFEWGQKRSQKMPGVQQHTVEDFFGILCDGERLPPLSTSEEALDLPPITVQAGGTLLPTARLGKDGRPVFSGAASMRTASVLGGARRPPVARSAYLRESFDSTSGPNFTHSQQYSGAAQGYGHESHASSASSLVASLGSRALSRMSLQHLTGAFSGLSGYLTNQGGAAVAAAKTCNAADLEEGSGGGGVWASVHPRGEDEDDDEGRRYDIESAGGGGKQQTRRYVRKSAVAPPKATPVWMLDFESVGGGYGPVFTL